MNPPRILLSLQRAAWWNCNRFSLLTIGCKNSLAAIVQPQFSTLSPKLNESFVRPSNLTLTAQRNYAVKKGSKKKGGSVQVNTAGLGQQIDLDSMLKEMETPIQAMKTDYIKSLSLRSAGSIESIKIKFEGKEYELQQIAKLTRKGQQTVVVDLLSFPQVTKAVMDTLKNSNLNLNPQQENTTIYIPIPKVTKEHREILAKKAKTMFISCRDAIKRTQEKYIRELKESPLADSEQQTAFKQVRAIADKYVAEAEALMKGKQDELLGK